MILLCLMAGVALALLFPKPTSGVLRAAIWLNVRRFG